MVCKGHMRHMQRLMTATLLTTCNSQYYYMVMNPVTLLEAKPPKFELHHLTRLCLVKLIFNVLVISC